MFDGLMSSKTNPTEYNMTFGNVFKEVAPSYGNPGMRNKDFGKMISDIHAITKVRMKND